jgi:hypothetical protein
MISYRKEVLKSWVLNAPSVRNLGTLLGVEPSLSLRGLINRMHLVESVSVSKPIQTNDNAPIGGRVTMLLRSNGSYVFSGHMRATGFYSYHFSVQAWVNVAEGAVIAAQKTGRIFGTDTPGPRQRNWSEAGVNRGVLLRWRSLRQGRSLGYNMHAEIGGVLGAARDVLLFVVRGVILRVALGPAGWFVFIGEELMALNPQLASPDILKGIAVGAGVLLIAGPFGLIPALVAGAATVALSDIRHRSMRPRERAFANRVFKGTIDFDKVVLTNLTHDGGRKFTIPSVGGAILVNMGDAFDDPMRHKSPPDQEYPEPGAVFIHELTHAWQIYNKSFIGVISGLSSNYDYFDARGRNGDTAWPKRDWGTFNNEQQAHIIDDWYGEHVSKDTAGNYLIDSNGVPVTDLDGIPALNDPAFHFVRDNIRPPNP